MSPTELRAYAAAERDAIRHRQGAAAAVVRDLRRCALKYGKATPSIEGMATRTGYCVRSIKYATAWLAARGRLTVYRRLPHCRKDGTWSRSQTNMYRMGWPAPGPQMPPKTSRRPRSHRGAMDCTSTAYGTVRAPEGGAPDTSVHDPDPSPRPVPPPTIPPPWITEGIDHREWLARQTGR